MLPKLVFGVCVSPTYQLNLRLFAVFTLLNLSKQWMKVKHEKRLKQTNKFWWNFQFITIEGTPNVIIQFGVTNYEITPLSDPIVVTVNLSGEELQRQFAFVGASNRYWRHYTFLPSFSVWAWRSSGYRHRSLWAAQETGASYNKTSMCSKQTWSS